MIRPFSLLAGLGALVWLTSCQAAPAQDPKIVTQENLLHTVIELRLFGNPPDQVFEQTFAKLASIGDRMTDYETSSEVSRISAQAGIAPVPVSADTLMVIQRGLTEAQMTNGIFDPTIGPVTHLWHIGDQDPAAPQIPTPDQIRAAQALVNWKDVVVDEKAGTVFLKKKGMVLDLGGLIKGYALDEALTVARAAKVPSGLFNMGRSTIGLLGKKPGNQNWKVGVQDPFVSEASGGYFAVIEGSDITVETSGPYQKFVMDHGKRYHHIMDPRTGAPAETGLEQVTLLLPLDTTLSDGLSTSCFILGLEKGMALVESLPDAAAIFVTSDHKVYLTSRVGSRFQLKDPNDKTFTVIPKS
jgi:thiamine biosynthesis lipoprotein